MGRGRRKSRSSARSVARMRETILSGSVAFLCSGAASYLGIALFGLPPAGLLSLGLVAGIIAALACRQWWLAGLAAPLGLVAGTLLGEPFLRASFSAAHPLQDYAVPVVMAALVGTSAAFTLAMDDRWRSWTAWLGVALIVVATWQCGWFEASLPQQGLGGLSSFAFYESTPDVSPGTSDEATFVLVARKMQSGQGYYSAMGQTIAGVNSTNDQYRHDFSSPSAFRLPTLYWFLAALPRSGQAWVIAMLVLVSGALVAAWTIAERYCSPSVALVGVVAVAAYLHGFTTVNLPDTELWAGPLGLIAVALALKSLSVRQFPLAWAAAAAAAGLMAMFVRELAVAFLLLGLASTLVHGHWRAKRLWIPWAAAVALAAVAYVFHFAAAAAVVATLRDALSGSGTSYFDPTGGGLLASVASMAGWAWWPVAVGWLVWASGTLGGALAPRDWPRRILLGGVTLGGAVALFFLHPMGTQSGGQIPSYWGQVVLPTVVACCVLPFSRLPLFAVGADFTSGK